MADAHAHDPDTALTGQIAEQRVSTLELFFDLVFVFALTQVTGVMSSDPTWPGVAKAMLTLAALWWAWGAYAWLTNAVRTERFGPRLAILGGMAAMLVVALAVPHAFGRDALTFAVAYLAVHLLHMTLYMTAGGRFNRIAIAKIAPGTLLASALLIVAAFVPTPAQYTIWVIAIAIQYVTPFITGVAGFTMSPSHFVERHALIVIIALGESIVAIGVGASGTKLDADVLLAGLVAVTLVSAIWWTYFEYEVEPAERALHAATGGDRPRMARDVFSYLHVPLIAGIVLMAVGIKKTIGHPMDPLKTVPGILLCAGAAIFLLGLAAIRLRRADRPGWVLLIAIAACLATILLTTATWSLFSLAVIAAVFFAVALTDRGDAARSAEPA